MDISTQSLTFRFIKRWTTYAGRARTLCEYMTHFLLGVFYCSLLILVAVSTLLVGGTWLGAAIYDINSPLLALMRDATMNDNIIYILTFSVVLMAGCVGLLMLAGLTIGLLFAGVYHGYKHLLPNGVRVMLNKPVTLGIFGQWIKAKMDKVCPIIKYTKE